MKTPPFLLGAALLFWGWQTGFLAVSAVLALALEAARFIKARWEFSDEDFSRIWLFCSLATLAATVYAFTTNDGPASFRGLLQDPSLTAQNLASSSSTRTAISIIRWLPLAFFLFVAAQIYSSRNGVPLETISLILARRWRRAKKLGQRPPESRVVNVVPWYFAGCLFAASAHASVSKTFFWGLGLLVIWALWPQRSARFGLAVWAAAAAVAIGLGYAGQLGLTQLQRVLANYNPQWFSHSSGRAVDPWQSRTQIGTVGRIKTSGEIIIRLKPLEGSPPPLYLREASYRTYNGTSWYAGTSRADFVGVNPTTNLTYVLLPNKVNKFGVNIACYLPGRKALLPLPSGCGRLENLFAFTLEWNTAGAVLAEGPGLVIFDARYGPGKTIDGPPDSILSRTNEDLDVPPREQPGLSRFIEEHHLAGLSREQQLRSISTVFQSEFSYSLWQKQYQPLRPDETPLSRFLLQTRHGHCEYFATATVLLLRQLGIPARYAVGYAVHEGFGNSYVVRQRDAHAWCLVWDPKDEAWHDLDTTPGSWVAEEAAQASPLQSLSDLWSRIMFEFSKVRWGQTHLRQYIFLSLIPVLAVLLYQIVFKKGRSRQRQKSDESETKPAWPGLDSEFYQLERQLVLRCGGRQPGEPLSNWLERLAADPALAPLHGPLAALLRLHYRHRFDPLGLNESERETLRREVWRGLGALEGLEGTRSSV